MLYSNFILKIHQKSKYSKSDKNEYLYIAFQAIQKNANMKVSGIIKGIILE